MSTSNRTLESQQKSLLQRRLESSFHINSLLSSGMRNIQVPKQGMVSLSRKTLKISLFIESRLIELTNTVTNPLSSVYHYAVESDYIPVAASVALRQLSKSKRASIPSHVRNLLLLNGSKPR